MLGCRSVDQIAKANRVHCHGKLLMKDGHVLRTTLELEVKGQQQQNDNEKKIKIM